MDSQPAGLPWLCVSFPGKLPHNQPAGIAIECRSLNQYTHRRDFSGDHLARIVGEYAPLASYCDTLAVPPGRAFTHLFELSVLDSGPGFAASWTGVPLGALSMEEEEAAVRACFGRGSARGQSRVGEGLPHVLRLLRLQKGFLRLRARRLSFFIHFSDEAQAVDGVLRRYEQVRT